MPIKKYFLDIKSYTIIFALLFAVSAFAGYISAVQNPQLAQEMADESIAAFEFIFDLNHAQMFLFIFANNSVKVFAAMMLGVIFGIAPIFFIFLNGFILGILFQVLPANFSEFAMAILPHGILEIPAAVVGSAAGFALGVKFFRKIFKKQNYNMRVEIKNSIRFFVIVLLPILFVAALIEVFITPLFIL